MCFPKAKTPQTDPIVLQQQQEARQRELDRLSEEKKKQLVADRRVLRGGGMRSLLTSGDTGSGFGTNYTG
jgi:predicted metallo-beta-lactamase superfamily hydrolase